MKRKSVITLATVLVFTTAILIVNATGIGNTNNIQTKDENDYVNLFSDVNISDWFYDDVNYVRQHNLMTGISENEFSPVSSTTRGMIVTILWRLENKPNENGFGFEDVDDNTYYHDAVIWASNNEIVSGYNNKLFGPNDMATREQFATIMYRYAVYKNYDVSNIAELEKYTDSSQISDYAVESLKWANATGLITGTSETTISPKDNVQRCQIAAILKRFCTNAAEQNEIGSVYEEHNNKKQTMTNKNNSHSEVVKQPEESNVTEPTIIVDSVEGKPGYEVELSVWVKNNPGILGMILTLYYDEKICTLESVENGDAVKDVLDMTQSKTLGNGAKFVWDGIEITGTDVKDGNVLKLKFKIKEDAPDGICPITVKYFNDDIIDNNLEAIYPIVKNGQIIVSK